MDQNSRLKEIEDLDSFLTEKNKLFSNILSTLSWSENSLADETKVQCPKDSGHWIPESSLSSHVETCSWVKDGYTREEKEKQPPSSQFFYQRAPAVNSLTLDKETLANILIEKGVMEKKPTEQYPDVPQTHDRWTVDFTPEQRLAVYDYVVKEGKLDPRHKNVTVEDLMFDFEKREDQGDKPKSQLELMAEQRDYKRRRQSYRAKNVHITKKSYTEVMKEVIENQITYLTETRKQETTEREEPASTEREGAEKSDDYESQKSHHHHRSRRSRSRSPHSKRRKHKKDLSRSRSRSRTRHHKKSHRKSKKSHS